jgi:hypothetical protein
MTAKNRIAYETKPRFKPLNHPPLNIPVFGIEGHPLWQNDAPINYDKKENQEYGNYSYTIMKHEIFFYTQII